MKKLIAIFAAIMLLLSMDAFAKSSGKASSFGSSSFSKPSSKSFSKPSKPYSFGSKSFAKPTSPTKPTKSYSFGGSKPSNTYKFGSVSGNTNSTPSKPSKLFEQFKAKNTTPSKRVVASDINKMFDKSYRTTRRNDYYTGYKRPSYVEPVIHTHSSYGAWDALLMWSLLDDISDRNMYYHHMNDPAFQSWRTDANQLCAQGNQEVCNKLKALDADIAALKAQGVKQDATYITDGVDPGIYLADNVKYEDLGEVKVCTGTMTSGYTRFANQLASSTKLKIKPIFSNGSIDNMKKLAAGECDLAFTQSDTIVSSELQAVFALNKPEQTMLVCNNNSGVKTVSDLTDKHTIYIGSDQSGSHFTYDALVQKHSGSLGKNKVDDTRPVIGAASIVTENDNACMFAVATYDSPYIRNLAKTNKAHFVAFPDKVDGYVNSYIDDNSLNNEYKTLSQEKYKSWFGFWSKGTPVLSVQPTLITTSTWAQNNPVVLYDVIELNKQYLKQELK